MKVLVTAGPTREFIDPVRFLSNRSTGKMGYAVASAFAEKGHQVVLVTGPVSIDAPAGVRTVPVVTAAEMLAAVTSEFTSSDCLVMAAAVADWKPVEAAASKLKKGGGSMALELLPTDDILKEVSAGRKRQILAGFAAETGSPLLEARRKLEEKGLDVIFANDVSAADTGFEVDTNVITCIRSGGREENWPLMSKTDAGRKIVKVLEELYDAGNRQLTARCNPAVD